jgi:hypothetical protein
MMKKLWSTASAHVVASTAVAWMLGVGRAIDFDRVVVEPGLAAVAGDRAATATAGLVAWAAATHAAVQRAVDEAQAVDVLEDVDLARGRPYQAGAKGGAEHPERGPVPETVRVVDVRLLNDGFHSHHAAGCRTEGRGRLDPTGSPARGRHGSAVQGLEHEVAGAVLVDVGRAVGHRLDLAGTEAGAGVVLPVGCVHARVGCAGEVVTPGGGEAGGWRANCGLDLRWHCHDAGQGADKSHQEDERNPAQTECSLSLHDREFSFFEVAGCGEQWRAPARAPSQCDWRLVAEDLVLPE